MTTLNVPARPAEDTSPRPVPWRRMAWITWRQHRFALAGVAALLGVLALYLGLTGLQLHNAYSAAAGCRPAGSFTCGNMFDDFNNSYGARAELIAGLLLAVPALIGAFAGAPVLGRKMGAGTFRYTWRAVTPGASAVLPTAGYTQWTSYLPATRFWPFQWIEGGWLLVLSVLFIAATG